MTNKEFGEKLELRTKDFAIRIIKLSANIPRTDEGRVIKNQISKSGTSVGANYREANRARSAADFRNKIKISEIQSRPSNDKAGITSFHDFYKAVIFSDVTCFSFQIGRASCRERV